jgi:hypothetical protein
MMRRAAVRIVVAGMVAAAALWAGGAGRAGVATAQQSSVVLVPPGEAPLLEAPIGHPISTEPACPNCFI